MEIVIKIPDAYMKGVKIENGSLVAKKILDAVYSGTPLPKGHGRLIDADDLLDDIGLEDCEYNRDINMGEIVTLEIIDRIPTIIEADGGGE